MEKIRIVWDIHYQCNYRCPYCWFKDNVKIIYAKSTPILVEEWVKYWNCLFEKYGSVHIEITGGEPFIYPRFVELVREIAKRHSIRVTTNLSANIDIFLKEIDPERVKVISSFHPSFADLEAFLKKAILLKERGYGDTVIYVAYPPQINQVDYYKGKFKEQGIVFSVTPFCGVYRALDYPGAYTEAEKEILKPYLSQDERRLRFTLNSESPRGRLCRAGQKSALLYDSGKVSRCGRLKDKPFANFFDKDFSLLDKPLPCEADFCPCDEHNFII